MKLKEFIAALNEFPADIDLSDLKTTLSIEKTIGRNSIQCAYLANHRIAGGHPWDAFNIWSVKRILTRLRTAY